MSGFWSAWIVVLAVLTLGTSLFLFVWGLWVRIPVEPDGTTGHNWDGIRESMHKLPWWWIALSAGSFAVAIGYLVLYPGLGNFAGTLGWSSEEQLRQDEAAHAAKYDARNLTWRARSIEQLAADEGAVLIGHRLYLDNCAACHGNEGHGNAALGAPDLTDAEWEFGGDGNAILATILNGRTRVMPPWGKALGDDGVDAVTAYVQSLDGGFVSRDWMVRSGQKHFQTFCVSCHGPAGKGLAIVGPDLTDASWLYGDNLDDVTASVRDGRIGVMPPWRERLGEDQSRLIAAWVLAQARPESHQAKK